MSDPPPPTVEGVDSKTIDPSSSSSSSSSSPPPPLSSTAMESEETDPSSSGNPTEEESATTPHPPHPPPPSSDDASPKTKTKKEKTEKENAANEYDDDNDDKDANKDEDKDQDESSSFDSGDFDASDDSGFSPEDDPTDVIIKCNSYKEKGNGFFKEGELDKAAREYRKGIFDLKGLNKRNTGDDQVKELLIMLHNNLSMVTFRKGKYKPSMEVATAALRIDPANVKALYRRALAHRKLGQHREAKRDLREAYRLDPSNAAVKKELRDLMKYMDDAAKREKSSFQKAFSSKNGLLGGTGGGNSVLYQDKVDAERLREDQQRRKKKREEEELKKRRQQWEDECVARLSNNQPAISFDEWDGDRLRKEQQKQREDEELRKQERKARKEAKKKQQQDEEDDDDEEDQLTEKEIAMLRGYKKTKDGRITSYFTREQSEEEKQLLANVAPQRLDASTAAAAAVASSSSDPAASSSNATAGSPARTSPIPSVSAWNQAGTTWEERNTTDWCSNCLTGHLKATTARHANLIAAVSSVENLTGDASVAVAGGKKRYIFDFHTKVVFEVRNDRGDDDDDDVVASGSFQLPDINSASHDELEVDIHAWDKKPGDHNIVEAACKCRELLVQAVRTSVLNFVNEFNRHY